VDADSRGWTGELSQAVWRRVADVLLGTFDALPRRVSGKARAIADAEQGEQGCRASR